MLLSLPSQPPKLGRWRSAAAMRCLLIGAVQCGFPDVNFDSPTVDAGPHEVDATPDAIRAATEIGDSAGADGSRAGEIPATGGGPASEAAAPVDAPPHDGADGGGPVSVTLAGPPAVDAGGTVSAVSGMPGTPPSTDAGGSPGADGGPGGSASGGGNTGGGGNAGGSGEAGGGSTACACAAGQSAFPIGVNCAAIALANAGAPPGQVRKLCNGTAGFAEPILACGQAGTFIVCGAIAGGAGQVLCDTLSMVPMLQQCR